MMRAARMLTTVAATALVALVSGHIVQNGDITAAKIGASLQSPENGARQRDARYPETSSPSD